MIKVDNKKRIMVFLLLFVFVISGCSLGKGLSDSSKSDTTSSTKNTTNVEESSIEKQEDISSNIEDVTDIVEFPYAVDISEIIVVEDKGGAYPIYVETPLFISSGVNAPVAIELGQGEIHSLGLSVNLYGRDENDYSSRVLNASYVITITNIPTKEITIFGGPGSGGGKRTVKVNTQIELAFYKDYGGTAFPFSEFDGDMMYLFYNNQGTISLATRNFAGNVGIEDVDTMMEYTLDDNHSSNQDKSDVITDEEKEKYYYTQIKEARRKQNDYANSLDPEIRSSVQSPLSAGIFEYNRLLMLYPEDGEIIGRALERVDSGE